MEVARHPAGLRKWLLIGCLVMLVFCSVLEAAHFHRDAQARTKCAICVAAHNTFATPVVIACALPQIIFTAARPAAEIRPCVRYAEASFFIRPPPAV